MITILATVDGSPASRAVLPEVEKLAMAAGARATLLTVVERPKATVRRVEVTRAPFTAAPAAVGGIEVPTDRRGSEPSYAESDDQALGRAIDEGKSFLAATAKPLKDRGIEVETEVIVDNDVAKAIIEYARRGKVDVIAMATHGRGGITELVQGSVAAAVVRSGVAPVLLIRPTKM
jgi:nucleotide-binding universal stress UspA family protein